MDNLVLGRLLHGEDVVVAERGGLVRVGGAGVRSGLLLDRNGCVRSAERFTRGAAFARERRFVTESWENDDWTIVD